MRSNSMMLIKLLVACFLFALGQAQLSATCSPTLSAVFPLPSVAKGYALRLVANGLTNPRDMKFDSAGQLLVVEDGVGVSAITFKDYGGGCVQAISNKSVVALSSLNHGLELSSDEKTLYASDIMNAYQWNYSVSEQTVTSPATVIVQGLNGSDHVTRTLLLSKTAPGMLVVSRGSNEDVDPTAEQLNSGSAQIRAFNLNNTSKFPYQWNASGTVLGWGLRNDVGIDEEPTKGGLYSVENGSNNVTRNGVDIRETNPAEKLNFIGYVGGTPSTPNLGSNFGYPQCYSVWNTSIPDFSGQTGKQIGFVSKNDTLCGQKRTPPLNVFAAHSAPIDLLFNSNGTQGWVTMRGSDSVSPAVGYGVGIVSFKNGSPSAPLRSQSAIKYVAQSHQLATCNKQRCWSPTGLAWDREGRLFMASELTGEIYMILLSDGSGPDS